MRSRRLWAILVTLVMLPLLAPATTGAAGTSGGAVSVYRGAANVSGVNDFSTWLGQPVTYASEFVDIGRGWDAVANPLWLLDAWGPWVKAQPGRRLALSVPLLPNSASGQLAQGASGSFDSYFATLGRNMVDRGLGGSVVRLGWEANGEYYPWKASTNPEAYKSFFRRVVDVMRAVPGAAFTFDWSTNSGVGGTSPITTFEQFYPGDAWVDVMGISAYDIKWQDSTSTPEQRWNFTLNQRLGLADHKAFAVAHNKPLSFPEWALWQSGTQYGGGGDNPYFVDRMADWFAAANTLYQSYFDLDGNGQNALSHYPNGQARYRARFGPPPPPPPTTTTTTTPPPPPTTTTTTTPPPPPSANLLDADTSGLEGSLGQWTSWYTATISRSTIQAKVGSAGLRVDITGPNGWGATLRNWPGFTAAPGAHTLSFWGKSGSGSNLSVDLKVRWRDASNTIIGTGVVTIPALTTTWQQATATVVAPPGTVRTWLELGHRSGVAGDVEYFDEFTLNRVGG